MTAPIRATPCTPALLLSGALALGGCNSCGRAGTSADGGEGAIDARPPVDLLEEGGAREEPRPDAALAPPDAALAPPDAAPSTRACPPEMVRVAGRFCVDRYEATVVDAATGKPASPYYPPSRKLASSLRKIWDEQRLVMGDADAQITPLPPLPLWEAARDFEPKAVSKRGDVPQGYTSGELAARACENAGKRLCKLDEWRTACRGDEDRPFPYGDTYVDGRCNVFRDAHPAKVLHDDPSIGHSDPRLNQVKSKGRTLLRRTGETATCYSRWGDDAIADMVGNLDEWIDDPEGTFVGGFYSRAKKDGCASTVANHAYDYFDYSTGIRCCADLPP